MNQDDHDTIITMLTVMLVALISVVTTVQYANHVVNNRVLPIEQRLEKLESKKWIK